MENTEVKNYLLMVEQDGSALDYVPEVLRTMELCKVAVEQDGSALCYVPEILRTMELCKVAVEQDGFALHHVPTGLRDKMGPTEPNI